ncbi:hypothetical protein [Muribaculum intestinale]|uniref:hypothetical protein n=1 Tax=Muribaculum intestinale TaxID=1796646 RepID=UPI00243025E6|nr:hypothetical protein [Muribaculum intestinale]
MLDATGAAANLTGADGQVMVEIPKHYRKFEFDGTDLIALISEYPLPGFHEVPKMYRSAYEATVDRTVAATPKLASVVNTTAAFRGGNNNATYDGTYRSFLGLPATAISLTNFRNYARNRGEAGLNGKGWNCDLYAAQLATYWLFVIEYANLNCQADYNAQPDANGYKQGGLGAGVTTMTSANWNTYNGYYPVVPCGATNSLGNASGVVEKSIDNGAGIAYTFKVPSYRGIENPFGHIWSWTDGCKCEIQSEEAGGLSKFYVCNDPAQFQDSSYNGYDYRGNLPRKEGYVKRIMGGEFGDNMPVEVGGGSTTYFADYFYTNIPASGVAMRSVLFGGCAGDGAAAGLSAAHTTDAASTTNANLGSRLCFIPAT